MASASSFQWKGIPHHRNATTIAPEIFAIRLGWDTIGPWQRPASGTFGNTGRNSLRGAGFFQTDLSIAEKLLLHEGVSVQFRTDVFNLFNKVNLDNPQTCVDCQNGGTIVNTTFAGAALQRQIMFSLRLQF
jgi:hypothetical protein